MAVTINKSDGTVLTVIQDGSVDTTNTNLSLVGRLYRNYGELINENFVKLLENFANSTSPTTPIIGQLWYDTTNNVLRVYRNTGFVGLARMTSSNAQPNFPIIGDLWYDTIDGQLKLYNGNSWFVVSPAFTLNQTKTGIFVENIRDLSNANHIALVHYQQNNIIAVECRDPEWIPQTAISGLSSVKPGYNLCNINGQKYRGTVENSDNLGGIAAANYLRNDISGSIDGSLNLTDEGLIVGVDDNIQIYNDGDSGVIAKGNGTLDFYFVGNSTPSLTINEESQILHSDGNESEPTISFINNTDMGLYRLDENVIGVAVEGFNVIEITSNGIIINGNIQADNFSGTLNAGEIAATNLNVSNTATINNLRVNGTTTLGNASNDVVNFNASIISIPNGLTFSDDTVTFEGNVRLGDRLTSSDGVANVYISPGLFVENTLNVKNELILDSSNRLTFNASPVTGFNGDGDFTMGQFNGVRAHNTAKYWVSFNGTLSGLAILDSFRVDAVTRTSTNNYAFTLEHNFTSAGICLVGSNEMRVNGTPSAGSGSVAVITTSESSRMGMVIYSA